LVPNAYPSSHYSQTITNKPEQQWYITAGKTKIQLANSTLCFDAGAKGEHPTFMLAQH
jgi:hypothetical protein